MIKKSKSGIYIPISKRKVNVGFFAFFSIFTLINVNVQIQQLISKFMFFFATGFDKKPLDINVDIGKMKPCHNEKVNNEKVNNVKVKTVKVKMSKPNIHFSGVKLSQTILRLFEVTCVVRLVHLEEFSSFVFLPNLSHAWRKVVASCSVVFFPSSC